MSKSLKVRERYFIGQYTVMYLLKSLKDKRQT